MTKKIKLFFLLLFASGFLLNSCDKDFEVDSSLNANQNSYNSNLKVSKVYFDDFKENTDLVNKIAESTGKNKLVQNQRLVHSTDDSFYIDTDSAYFIEDENGRHSYTFQIIRQNSQYLLENLVVNQSDSLDYNLYIAQYDINAMELQQLLDGQNPNIIDKINIVPITDTSINVNTLLGRGSGENMCWTETVVASTCPGPEHHTLDDINNGASCPYYDSGQFSPYVTHVIYTYGPCGEDSGGGDPVGENPSGPGNTGGGIGTVITTPVITPPIKSGPCAELKKISDKPQFVTNMQALKANISGATEKGFIIRDKEGADAFSAIVEGDVDGNVTYPYAFGPIENLYSSVATAHNHLNSQIGIFTPEDLQNLWLNGALETHPDNPNLSTSPKKATIFVITNKGLFALKINDIAKLFDFVEEFKNMTKEVKKAYLDLGFKNKAIYNVRPESTYEEQVKGFLRFMQDEDIGVDLYEGNATTFGGWQKLELTNNNGVYGLTQTPCTN